MDKRLILFLLFLISFTFVSAGELKVTEEHPFLINGSWIDASQLKVGDELTLANGSKVTITKLTDVVANKSFKVYNLEAGQYHNFVVGEEGVIVHNSNGKDPGVCFDGDTLIYMVDGSQKKIKDILPGEEVVSYNFLTNKKEKSKVGQIESHISKELYLINGNIKVTAEHPFWIPEIGWAAINSSPVVDHPEIKIFPLKEGLNFIDYNGQIIPIASIVKLPSEEYQVYNLVDVGLNHNYYAGSVLVHNQGNPCAERLNEELPYDPKFPVALANPVTKPIQGLVNLNEKIKSTGDYSPMLNEEGKVTFWVYSPSGKKLARPPLEAFKFHITSEPENAEKTWNLVSEICKKNDILFKIASESVATGQLRSYQVGKFATVYPNDVQTLIRAAKQIDNALLEAGLNPNPAIQSITDRSIGQSGRIAYRYATNAEKFNFLGGNKRISMSQQRFVKGEAPGRLSDRRTPGDYNPIHVFDEVEYLAAKENIPIESPQQMFSRVEMALDRLEQVNVNSPSRLEKIQDKKADFLNIREAYRREGYLYGTKKIVPDMTKANEFDELYSSIYDMGAYYSEGINRYVTPEEAVGLITQYIEPSLSSGSISAKNLNYATRTNGVRDAVRRILISKGITITP